MKADRAFQYMNVALILAGAAAFEYGAGWSPFFPVCVAVCVFYLRNERSASPARLPNLAANIICLAAFSVVMAMVLGAREGTRADVLHFRTPVVGRYLMLVQWLLLFRRHTNRDYGWIYFISLAHVAGGALLNPDVMFAVFFAAYLLIAVATLSLFHRKQELERAGKSLARGAERVGGGFFGRCAAGSLVMVLPIGVVFAALPRGQPGAFQAFTAQRIHPITGFTDSVRLGDIARIQKSDSRVMQVRALDGRGNWVKPGELMMRGVALDVYDGKRWSKSPGPEQEVMSEGGALRVVYDPAERRDILEQAKPLRCEVTLEPIASRALFAPFALLKIFLPVGTPIIYERNNESLRTAHHRRRSLKYKIESRVVQATPPAVSGRARVEGARVNRPNLPSWRRRSGRKGAFGRPIGAFLDLPGNFPKRVHELARRVARMGENPTKYERAVRIRNYLADPTNFRYTLDLRPRPGADPIDDFLFRSQAGNCEYFASAMALMLRCVGVESRLVNGFRGGEWNALGRFVVLRQRDAHSWVEADVPPTGWAPFDPTPAAGGPLGESGAPRTGGLRTFMDFVQQLWVDYVVGFDREKQGDFYHALDAPRRAAHAMLTNALYSVLGDRNLSPAGGRPAMSFRRQWLMTLIPVALAIVAVAVAVRLIRRRGRPRRRRTKKRRRTPVAFYEKFLRLMRRRGFKKPDEWTPAEFADHVMATGGPGLEAAGFITWRFYETRFGGRALTEEREREARDSLRTLARALARRRRRA